MRGSRSVLRETGGEVPPVYSPHFAFIFYNAGEEYWEASRCRETIDYVFQHHYLNLKEYISLPDEKRKNLIRLLDLPCQLGMRSIEKNCFTLEEFTNLSVDQQEKFLCFFLKFTDNYYDDRAINSFYTRVKDRMIEIKHESLATNNP